MSPLLTATLSLKTASCATSCRAPRPNVAFILNLPLLPHFFKEARKFFFWISLRNMSGWVPGSILVLSHPKIIKNGKKMAVKCTKSVPNCTKSAQKSAPKVLRNAPNVLQNAPKVQCVTNYTTFVPHNLASTAPAFTHYSPFHFYTTLYPHLCCNLSFLCSTQSGRWGRVFSLFFAFLWYF